MSDLTHDGITQPITEWAADYGIPCRLIRDRLKRGWSVERAITQTMNVRGGMKLVRSDMHDKPAPASRPAKRHTYQGEALTVREWAERIGVNRSLLDRRLGSGWTIEQAITGRGPVRTRFNMRLPKRPKRSLTLNGETLTIGEWAERLGVSKNAIHQRLASGWTLERALTTARSTKSRGAEPKLLTLNGETLTLKQWADRLGLNPTTIITRLNRGKWSVERTLTTGNTRGRRTPEAANDDRPLEATA